MTSRPAWTRGAPRRSRRITFAALIVGATLTPFAAIRGSQAAGSAPTIRVTAGYSGFTVTAGTWIPLTVSLHGGASDLTGTLVVRNGPSLEAGQVSSIADPMTYRVPVDLPAAQDRTVKLYVEAQPEPVHVELRDSSGSAKASTDASPLTGGVGHLLVGVIASQTGHVPSVGGPLGLGTGIYNVDAVPIAADRLPDTGTALGAFAELLVDGAATEQWSRAQRQAVVDFVAAGGGLIMTTGESAAQTLAGIDPALQPARPGGTVTEPLAAALASLASTAAPATPIVRTQLAVRPGARVLTTDTRRQPLVASLDVGEGRVAMVGIDPATDPLASWPGQHAVLAELLTSALPGRIGEVLNGTFPGQPLGRPGSILQGIDAQPTRAGLAAILTDIPGIQLPSATLIAALGAGYILLVGPVSYLVLARLRRRDLLWVTVPVLAVVGAIAAYGVGSGIRGSSTAVGEVRVVELNGTARADVTTLAAIYTPRGGGVSIQVAPASASVAGYAQLSDDDALLADVANGAQMHIDDARLASLHGFSTQYISDLSTLGLTASLSRQGTHLRGTVRNDLGVSLVDAAVVGSDGVRHALGTINAGATVTVDTTVGTPFSARPEPPGFCSDCSAALAQVGSDREARRQLRFSQVLQLRAAEEHPGIPVLVGIASSKLLPDDLSGAGSLDSLDAVLAPLVQEGSAGTPGGVPRLLYTDASTANIDSSGGFGPSIPFMSDGQQAIFDYAPPTSANALTITFPVPLCNAAPCFTTSANGSLVQATPRLLYDVLDARSGNWVPITGHRVGGTMAAASIDPALAQGSDLLVRVRASQVFQSLQAPVLTAAASSPARARLVASHRRRD